MALGSLTKNILALGHWKQCLFCNRALPTKAQHLENCALAKRCGGTGKISVDGSSEFVEESGYCNYCEEKGLRLK